MNRSSPFQVKFFVCDGQVFFGVMAHISLLREATVFIFKDPSGWLLLK